MPEQRRLDSATTVAAPFLVEVGMGDASTVCAALQEALRAGLGIRLQVTVAPPRSLPRFELKARRVVRR